METVSVFHQKFTNADKSAAGSCFVAIFRFELVEHKGELLVARNHIAHKVRHRFFVSHGEYHAVLVPVFKTEQLFADGGIASGFIPEIRRLHDGQIDFDSSDGVHFLADQVFNFFENPKAHRKVTVNARGKGLDIAAPHQKDVAWHCGIARRFAEGGVKEL